MMVLYTADIGKARASLHRTACDIRVEASYMADAPSAQWLKEIKEGIVNGTVTEETLMHLVLLPLAYHGNEQQQAAIRQCVDLAKELPDKEQGNFVLAGILAFTDKIIGEDMKKYIKEVLRMTRIESELIEESRQEGRQEGDYERAKKTAFKMYEKKYPLEHIAELIEFPISTIQEWLAESPSKA